MLRNENMNSGWKIIKELELRNARITIQNLFWRHQEPDGVLEGEPTNKDSLRHPEEIHFLLYPGDTLTLNKNKSIKSLEEFNF